jgi:hypothetical protein
MRLCLLRIDQMYFYVSKQYYDLLGTEIVLGLNCKINMTQVKFSMIESLPDQWPLNSVTQ